MKLGRWIKRRLIEPSTPIALAFIGLLIKPDFDAEVLGQVYNGVVGVLAALGIIQPEGTRKEED
jgi:hypothetical protein